MLQAQDTSSEPEERMAGCLVKRRRDYHYFSGKTKHVTFRNETEVLYIAKIPTELKDMVFCDVFPKKVPPEVIREINHVKLFMEVHPLSRANTQFYVKNVAQMKECFLDYCRHDH